MAATLVLLLGAFLFLLPLAVLFVTGLVVAGLVRFYFQHGPLYRPTTHAITIRTKGPIILGIVTILPSALESGCLLTQTCVRSMSNY